MTPWQKHVERWRGGCGSCLCGEPGVRVILGRGQVPAEIVFVGEAPGVSENAQGKPLIGPAGKLLDAIIEKAVPAHVEIGEDGNTEHVIYDFRMAFTNLVGCFPKDAKQTENHAPPESAIKTCGARLIEFLSLCKPRLVVCVGALSEKWVPVICNKKTTGGSTVASNFKTVAITHPASILRMPDMQQGLAIQRAVVVLANAVADL